VNEDGVMAKSQRNQELKKAWREQERAKLVDSIPIPHKDLRALFDFLDRENPPPCDRTLRETIQFLEERSLDVGHVVDWLREYGGYCDCEVIFNVHNTFGPIVGSNRLER
jgi:hypothetical protein